MTDEQLMERQLIYNSILSQILTERGVELTPAYRATADGWSLHQQVMRRAFPKEYAVPTGEPK